MAITAAQQDFVEEFSRLDAAMPRAMGLILGYLLVCEPAEQTSVAMQKALDLSSGSISTMIAMLVDSGLVSRVKKTNDRKWYYLVAENSWQRTIEMRLQSIVNFRDTAEKGMAVTGNYRMKELYNVFDLFATELEHIAQKLNQKRQT